MVVCEPNAEFCENNAVRLCNPYGSDSTETQVCFAGDFCSESPDFVECAGHVCEPGQAACDGERLATCADDGGSYSERTTDCTASGQVCNLTACVDAGEDTVGAATESATAESGTRVGNFFYTHTERVLIEIRQYASASETTELTWFVYEEGAKIFEGESTGSGDASFQSSGTIAVRLVAARSYLIGVHFAEEAAYYYDPYEPPENANPPRRSRRHTQSLQQLRLFARWPPRHQRDVA